MILDWIDTVNKTILNSLKNFAKVTKKELLNWFDCPISNGKAEGDKLGPFSKCVGNNFF